MTAALHNDLAEVYERHGVPEMARSHRTIALQFCDHEWASLRTLCMDYDPQVCARCGAKRIVPDIPPTP